jgi:adenylate cyclase
MSCWSAAVAADGAGVASRPQRAQNRDMAIADFALKLGLVLKTFNLSRGRLAQTVEVDKSVVSRWASGVQVPSDHNLSLLTEAVARLRPGFERRDWDLDAEGFANKLDFLEAGASSLALPDKPSIAVLPFQNMSGDPEQEYFTDGITEDIITELSRFHSLFVIARNSSFSYKGKSPDIRQVGRDLGVRYVLEGSIRKSSNRIRVTGELVDTFTGNHLWAERYDRVLEDIFAVQEEVTQSIVAVIAPQIESTEQSKAARRRPDNVSAYEMGLLAWAHAWQGYAAADRTLLDQAIREARDALAIDPRSVLALHTIAYARGISVFLLMAVDREHALQEAMWAAARAIELDSTDALGYALRARCVLLGGQLDRYSAAIADAQRAHEMNPNDVFVLGCLAWLEAVVGEYERAIEHGHQILRLNPSDPRSYEAYHMLGFANFGRKQYAESIGWEARALNDKPEMIQPHLMLAICYVGANEIAKARAMFAAGQRLAPEYVKSRLEGTWAYTRPEDIKRATTFFRMAAGLEDPSAAEELR